MRWSTSSYQSSINYIYSGLGGSVAPVTRCPFFKVTKVLFPNHLTTYSVQETQHSQCTRHHIQSTKGTTYPEQQTQPIQYTRQHVQCNTLHIPQSETPHIQQETPQTKYKRSVSSILLMGLNQSCHKRMPFVDCLMGDVNQTSLSVL